jgi:hypothetical protein
MAGPGRRLPDQAASRPNAAWLVKELIHGYRAHCVATLADLEIDKVRLALRPVREMYGDTPAANFGPLAYQAIR